MIVDNAYMTTKQLTPEGYLKGQAVVTCEGVQEYAGCELQADMQEILDPYKIYKVFRPASAFLNTYTIESLKLKPVTYQHPEDYEKVEAANFSEKAVGIVGENTQNVDDKQLLVNFMITDPEIAQFVANNRLQVSLGYKSSVVPKSGTYNGEAYDFVFDDPMEINHLAIMPQGVEGRCSEGAYILDQKFVKKGDSMNNNQDPNDFSTALNNFAGQFMGAIQNMVQNTVKSMMAPPAPPKSDEMGDTPDLDSDVTADANTQNALGADKIATVQSDGCLTQNDANGDPDGDASSPDTYTDEGMVVVGPSPDQVDEASPEDVNTAVDMLDTARTIAPSLTTDSKHPKLSLVHALKENGYTDQALNGRSSDFLLGLATQIKVQRTQAKAQVPQARSRPVPTSSLQNPSVGMGAGYMNDSGMCSDELSLAKLRNDRATKLAKRRHERLEAIKFGVK